VWSMLPYVPVGYADKNSAKDAARQRLQTPAVIRPHITAAGPPDGSARDREVDKAVHELRMAKASPSMDSGLWLRFSSCFKPKAARWSESSIIDCRRPIVAY